MARVAARRPLAARRGACERLLVEPPSARPWIGVGAALSALPAAGGCFCAALILALVADSDPGGVYEQHRWLGAIVAAGAVCAYVAMMGWATLRHGGLPAPVLLIALVLGGVPFLLPGSLFIPAAVVAVAASAALATAGLAHPPASPDRVRSLCTGLALTALVLAVGQAIVVSVHSVDPSRANAPASQSASSRSEPAPARADDSPSNPTPADSAPAKPAPAKPAPAKPVPAKPVPADATPAKPAPAEPAPATRAPTKSAPAVAAPTDSAPAKPVPAARAPAGSAPVELAPAGSARAAVKRWVRDYYAAIDGQRFRVAWRMLSPGVQSAFGGFAAWREGYGRTLSQAPGAVRVTAAGAGATVGLTLVAGDNACGKIVERRFAVTWRLARTDAGWRATAASARKLGPQPC